MNLTGIYLPFPGIRQGATATPLTNLQCMHPFQIVSQANKRPLATGSTQTAQGELTKAQHFLDDANHGFHSRFTQAVKGVTNFGTQLVSHLLLHRSTIWQWVKIIPKKGAPTLMVRTASGGNVRVKSTFFQASYVALAEIACVQISFFRLPLA